MVWLILPVGKLAGRSLKPVSQRNKGGMTGTDQ